MTSAIILAGGLGTRLRGTVPDVPKPMAPLNGRPFLEYQIEYWIAQGVENFILSVGYKYEVIIQHFGATWMSASISYVIEEIPLGTGGGLLMAAKGMGEPFLVLNGDTFFEVDLKELKQFHNIHQSEWTFALFKANEVGRYMGMDIADDGSICSLQSNMIKPGRLANGGVYLLEPSILDKYQNNTIDKVSLEDDILPYLHGHGGRLYGVVQDGCFVDIGVPEDYLRASQILSQV